MSVNEIRIGGARQHNLKNVSVTIPRGKLVVFTGVSGSGKSSLAFDTLYAEGQRRYVESLSVYARQFLDQLEKPDVDYIEGLSPAIAIEQRTSGGNPRSTVATTTEIYDFLRLLFAHLGTAHHPETGKPLKRETVQQIADRVLALPEGTPVQLLAPLILDQKGEFRDIVEKMKRDGYVRARIDGAITEIENVTGLDRNKHHTIEAVIDRVKVTPGARQRVAESLETALREGRGIVVVLRHDADGKTREWRSSNRNFDPETGAHFEEMTPRHFSFNSPQGACPVCHGLGVGQVFDPELVVPDPAATLEEMPIAPWKRGNAGMAAIYKAQLAAVASHYGLGQLMDRKWEETPEAFRNTMLHGSGEEVIPFAIGKKSTEKPFEGVLPQLARLYRESESELTRQRLARFMSRETCEACHGARLKKEVLAVTLAAAGPLSASPPEVLNIDQLCRLSVEAAFRFVTRLEKTFTAAQEKIGRDIVRELKGRLKFLVEVGLGYLELNRESGTLSGGESQRIRLASQIGSQLTGVLYILDEPSIGLHQRDNDRLLAVLRQLRDLGNSLVVVEHDDDTIRAADYLVDLGPYAGVRGGQVVAAGTVAEVEANEKSLTGRYLSGRDRIEVPKARVQPRPGNPWLKVIGARENNLKNVDAAFPLGLFTCVTGVSGSGKSTLVNDVLSRALFRHFHGSKERPGLHDRIEGVDFLDKVVEIDQSPIGRTPRSNPLTYTGAFNGIRDLFAQLPSSRVRGYGAGRFSFNVAGGRCEHCEGGGMTVIEMNFLPPVYVPCEVCNGRRFNRETLEITYKGRTIADVLEMTVDDGLALFRNIPAVGDKLEALASVGLGYIRLGQQGTTLSGGEAQRIKLAAELAKKATGRTVYLLDEPTTGLHWADIELLLAVLGKLRDAGNTLIVIEHNLHLIKCADYVIDLGPEGGKAGGKIVATGTPEDIAANPESRTGHYLKTVLSPAGRGR
ncbi:Excinuclease ABC subunit A [Verrucomicrobium sp. GAS474]|uniref:excinuclease ABC subunit UvrA n=1 Tax=Verrucomicrobium sp. GAS474 TaxID=1882831 RepID=UPI00087A180B|nr:excinuclease ABC subunit UvrA [Verrucomicrobium sp. GAS474]SDT86997.1 Excinuclease ABC subunit A [Verrucomicrobium sp. GAS474]